MSKVKSKRRFWQVHLSTAVLLMFTLGGWMFLNFKIVGQFWESTADGPSRESKGTTYGIPLRCVEVGNEFFYEIDRNTWDGKLLKTQSIFRLKPLELGIDIAVALAIVSVVALIFELRIRRCEARKT